MTGRLECDKVPTRFKGRHGAYFPGPEQPPLGTPTVDLRLPWGKLFDRDQVEQVRNTIAAAKLYLSLRDWVHPVQYHHLWWRDGLTPNRILEATSPLDFTDDEKWLLLNKPVARAVMKVPHLCIR